MSTLVDKAALPQIVLLNEFRKGSDHCGGAGAVDLVQPKAHVVNYIKIYLINSAKINF
jgi:hypothetical protein